MKVLRVILPLALVAVCLVLAGGRGVWERLSDLSLSWLALAVVLLNAVIVLSALRWKITATALGLPLPTREAVGEYYMAQFVNQTLPGGVLGDAARAMRSRNGGPVTPAAQAVVLERASGQVGMAAVLALGAAGHAVRPEALPRLNGAEALPVWLPAAVLVAFAAVLGTAALSRRLSGSWGAAVRTALLGRWRAQGALSVGVAALTVTAFAVAALATGTTLHPLAAAFIVPLILTAMLLPASVAGWGWREGAAAVLFPLAGADAAAGLAASIAFGIAALIAALPGAFFVLRRTPQRRTSVASSRR